ncbi:MAG: archease [Candidatus Anstonellales archaeon]
MGQYEFLEHTADIKIRAKGKNFADAMEGAFNAIISIINEKKEKREKEEKLIIEVREKFLEDVVVNALEKLITYSEIEKIMPYDVKVISFDEMNNFYSLKAIVFGYKVNEIETPIKAVTYHQLVIKEIENETIIEFIIDI